MVERMEIIVHRCAVRINQSQTQCGVDLADACHGRFRQFCRTLHGGAGAGGRCESQLVVVAAGQDKTQRVWMRTQRIGGQACQGQLGVKGGADARGFEHMAQVAQQAVAYVDRRAGDTAQRLAECDAGGGALQALAVPYRLFVLENGLTVILHRDTSVPVVSAISNEAWHRRYTSGIAVQTREDESLP